MRSLALVAVCSIFALSSQPLAAEERSSRSALTAEWASEANKSISLHFADLEKTYKHLHSHPELSYEETQTSAFLGKQMSAAGFVVTPEFGGHGLVAVLKNGVGPTVLVRTEMDALPIEEKTGLPYASKVQGRDRSGNLVGVMHACGHDVHMTCWLGAANALASMKERWRGTLVFIAQPAEEAGMGAHMMLQAGLYSKFPRPDFCFALHCDAEQPCGTVAYTPGLAMANIDMVDITMKGKGGHGAWPHLTVDPVVMSARVVLDLQTLVSRETNPTDPVVVTVGTIHGGVKPNVIPNDVKLQLTVRTTKELTRKRVLQGIERMAKAAAIGAGAPEPSVTIRANWFTPAVVNDPQLLEKTLTVLRDGLGDEHVKQRPPMMGGEDFSLFGRAGVPSVLFFLGTQQPERIAQSEIDAERPLTSLHSDRFAPVVEPTLRTGALSMSLAVMNLLGKTELTQAARPAGSLAGGILPVRTARSKIR
ncbi:MAG: amidohydrolase [Gemmataceae bacterium]|nr:amidohydrolase [Gemmataceae bacterium]